MPAAFTRHFAGRLDASCKATVKVPLGAVTPQAGQPVWLRFPQPYLRVYV